MTDLLGLPTVDWSLAAAYARRAGATDDFCGRAELYWAFGQVAGIRPEVAYLQHAHESGWGFYFGTVPASHHNCAGIKVARPNTAPWPEGMNPDPRGSDYNPLAHEQWATWAQGIAGHYTHLLAYAYGADAHHRSLGVPHPRFELIASLDWPERPILTVEGLDRWAGGPGSGYGPRLADRLRTFLGWAVR